MSEEKDWKEYIMDEKEDENPDKQGWTIKEHEPLNKNIGVIL